MLSLSIMDLVESLTRNPSDTACSLLYILFAILKGNMDRRRNYSIKLLSFFVGLGCFYQHWLLTLWLFELISASISFLNEVPRIRTQIAQSTAHWDYMSIFLGKALFGYTVLLATAFIVPTACYFFYSSRFKMWITYFFIISSVYYCLTGSKLAEFGRKWIHPMFTDHQEMLDHLTPAIIDLIPLCISLPLCSFICLSEGRTHVSVYCILWNVCSLFEWFLSHDLRAAWCLHKRRQMRRCAVCGSELRITITVYSYYFIQHSACCNECDKCGGIVSAARLLQQARNLNRPTRSHSSRQRPY